MFDIQRGRWRTCACSLAERAASKACCLLATLSASQPSTASVAEPRACIRS